MKGFVNILVCDDNKNFVKCISNYISEKEKQIRVSSITFDGKEAIEKIKKTKPDIVLLDLNMPQISGYEVLEEIQKVEECVPIVIIITGIQYNQKQLIKYSFIYGIIQKGTSYENILEYIREIIKETSNIIIEKRIKEELLNLGFKLSNKSTKCLIDAIIIALYISETENKTIKDIFVQLENKYNTKYIDMISNIQKAIDIVWINRNQKDISNILGLSNNTKPTVKIIIDYYCENYKAEKINKFSNGRRI